MILSRWQKLDNISKNHAVNADISWINVCETHVPAADSFEFWRADVSNNINCNGLDKRVYILRKPFLEEAMNRCMK